MTKFFIEIIEQLLAAKKAGYVDEGVQAAERLVFEMGAVMVEKALHAALFKVHSYSFRQLENVSTTQHQGISYKTKLFLYPHHRHKYHFTTFEHFQIE